MARCFIHEILLFSIETGRCADSLSLSRHNSKERLSMPKTPAPKSDLALLGGKPIFSKPISAPWPPVDSVTERDLAAVYRSRHWSFNGEREQAFARQFAKYHGAKHGVVMANGTVTLQAALTVLGIGPGDEVIVPALTWFATAMAAHYVGAKPVFVDVEPTTLCLDPKKLDEARTPRTKAVIAVHLYGGMADLEAILAWGKKHKVEVVEDCAHMHGGVWNGRGAGSWGRVGSFSFQQSKTMAAGEGGICLTNDDELAERLFLFKHIGYSAGTAQGGARTGPPPGLVCHNFRATEFQAVILQNQLKGLRGRIRTYNKNAARIEKRLNKTDAGLRVQSRGRRADPQGYYQLLVLADRGPLADVPMPAIHKALAAEGVHAGGTYGPVYRHRLWNLEKRQYRIVGKNCPVAEEVGARGICLSHQLLGLEPSSIDRIGDALVKVASHAEELNGIALNK
jgi:L-glutamine:2-deoxy-scyllo-inosose/3-amino-2,3-dideoxy-scyllo-inosose aminotransferase